MAGGSFRSSDVPKSAQQSLQTVEGASPLPFQRRSLTDARLIIFALGLPIPQYSRAVILMASRSAAAEARRRKILERGTDRLNRITLGTSAGAVTSI